MKFLIVGAACSRDNREIVLPPTCLLRRIYFTEHYNLRRHSLQNILGTLSLLLHVAPHASSQGLPVAAPEEIGLSTERLKRIRPVMGSYVDENKLPGIMTMVARRGKYSSL